MTEGTSIFPPDEPAANTSVAVPQVVDMLLGLALALLALDHMREFFSGANYWPSDLGKTTPPLFFTHWVTHMAAPVFVFLTGTAACLSLSRGLSRNQLSRYLLTRGFALILLEVTVISFGWSWEIPGPVFLLVFWAAGISMVTMAGLIYLPIWAVAGIGLVMLTGHNTLDYIKAEDLGYISTLWQILHAGGKAHLGPLNLYIVYPVIPWVGIMAVGYALGPLLQREKAERRRVLTWLGLGLILAFAALRLLNGYGDKHPWGVQDDNLFTVMSFLNTTGYPPSLQYLLMTLGLAILLMPWLERLRGPLAGFLATLGRAPFFFFVLQLYLAHISAVAVALAFGGPLADMLGPFWDYKEATGFGFALPWVYLAWLAELGLLYAACRWYAGAQARGHPRWLVWL